MVETHQRRKVTISSSEQGNIKLIFSFSIIFIISLTYSFFSPGETLKNLSHTFDPMQVSSASTPTTYISPGLAFFQFSIFFTPKKPPIAVINTL